VLVVVDSVLAEGDGEGETAVGEATGEPVVAEGEGLTETPPEQVPKSG